ncbi:hypothetical protein SAMN04487829_1064 [Pseudobutyrivibrio sp. NOR37]|uniref:Uncharacterized protein n=2 Tax=Pseudobutyrivibrio TaxID=46205 RepID=A0A2G3E8B4_9FIRM|nr:MULTISPECIES: hypothetical protein [Pseudobutyrivibrio]NEX01471.1 hypothetical protein [Pseudobutyrivibrio xylanivorans]PHU39538.1 hypothetical protein CSX00_11020 [Pseudobutyrivibrio ruminis]SFR67748.1 hypothetical protein SAMN04487829_1064 [Pseudobutyrivibrio sp. NOR37]
MEKIILIWNYPHFFGVPIISMIYKKKYKRFVQCANQKLKEFEIEMVLDDTFGDIEVLLKNQYKMIVFIPGCETKYWMWMDDLKKTMIPSLIFTESEMYNADISRVLHLLKNINN